MQPGLKSQVLLSIGVPRILQWRGFTWWGPGLGDGSPPSWVQEQSPGRGSWGQSPPEAEAKCEINVQFLTLSCIKFWI